MKKGTSYSEKTPESRAPKKQKDPIKFILNQEELACFKSQRDEEPLAIELKTARDAKTMAFQKIQSSMLRLAPISITQPLRQRPRINSFRNNFDEKVVIMHYDDIDVYVDNSTKKKTNSSKSKSNQSISRKKIQELQFQDELVSSCVRVITEETDITSSNGYSHIAQYSYRNVTPPRNYPYAIQQVESNQYYYPRNKTNNRKGRSVTVEQSRALSINYETIELDGRTTIMVKNIPNKYTQDMLLEEFSYRCPGNIEKYDFFYLPIDKNNQCNIGYAFVNFINPSFIRQFYLEFHQRKWKKYKSPKTCQLSYAVCQGTLELANHFKHTKTLQQKDKRLRPLIGANLVGKIKQIKQIRDIVESQRTKQ